jgi:WD40 repeat protein
MTLSARTSLLLLVGLAVSLPGSAKAGPADDLLPPPVRQTEKHSLGGDEDRGRRAFYEGRGGVGAAFSPDGKLLVTASGYQGMTVWDVGSGRALGQFLSQSNSEGVAAAFTPDGKQLVAAHWGMHREGCPVGLWDVAKRERVRSLDEDVNDVAFTGAAVAPDGKTVALAGGWSARGNEGSKLVFWDLASGDEVGQVTGLPIPAGGRRNEVTAFHAVAYSPDGRTLAALLGGRVFLAEVASRKFRGQMTFPSPNGEARTMREGIVPGALAFTRDGRTLVAGCSDGVIRRFDLRTGREMTPLPGHSGPVVALCCTPDGKAIHSYSLDGQFFVWRVDSGREWKPKAGPLPDGALETLWDTLRSDDPLDLFGCQEAMAAGAAEAVPFLRKRLSPAPKAETERVERLVADLQKGDYNARKKAVIELRKVGAAALPALERSQERGGFDDLLRRLTFELQSLSPPPEQKRATRALAVLERVGNAGARTLLEELAGGAPEAALTIEAKAALDRLGKAEPAKVAPSPDALWEELADEDGSTAYRAVRALANRPATVPLLRDRLKQAAAGDRFNDDPKRVAKLIADLDSDQFPVRDNSQKAIRTLGRLAVPALRTALANKPSAEAKRHLQDLLDEATKGPPPLEVLRVGRAMESLELIGGPEAREALEVLAKDVPTPWLREAASESLRRLGEGKR